MPSSSRSPLGRVEDLFRAPPDPAAPRHLPTLDGARGFAAGVVVMSHCANEGLLPAVLGNSLGKLGVTLFFVLSGFLMAYLYGDTRPDGAAVKRYAVHRGSRVLPLFYLVALLSIAFGPNGAPVWFFDVHGRDVPLTLLLLHGVDVMWTIPVEIHYYVAFVFVWIAMWRRNPLAIILAAAFSQAAILLPIVLVRANDAVLPYWFHLFFVGSLAGYLYRRHHSVLTRWSRSGMGQAAGWIVLLLALIAPPELRRSLHVPVLPIYIDPISVGAPVLIFAASLLSLGPFRWMAWRPLRWLGGISYGLYLIHKPVLYTLLPHAAAAQLPGWVTFILVFAGSCAVAQLSAAVFERPLQRLLGRLARPKAAARTTSPPLNT